MIDTHEAQQRIADAHFGVGGDDADRGPTPKPLFVLRIVTGADGRYPAPPHDATGHTWHHSDTDLIAYITLGGEKTLMQMGVSFDNGMPGFGDVLSQRDIEDILAYIKSR